MKKQVLLTRPRFSSERWASLLARHGFDSIIDPLLTIELLQTKRPGGSFQACFITSTNAIEALEELKPSIADLLTLPCFCVGTSTGNAARSFGFVDIRCGNSDGAALAQIAALTLANKTQPLLHISGDIITNNAQNTFAKSGFVLTSWAIYHARASDDLSAKTYAAFKAGTIFAIPCFSPRSARILVSIIEKNGLTQACNSIVAVGLSQAVVDVLKLLPWRQLLVATTPSEENVLASLQTEFP